MTPIFVSILERSIKQGVVGKKIADAREWFRGEAAKTNMSPTSVIRSAQSEHGSKTAAGKRGSLLLFSYDPKEKIKIPYYDRYPLVFPFRVVDGGFYGINMHYLPHQYRAVLMDGLYQLVNNTNYDETTKLKVTYEVLSGYARMRYFRPCVKRYLNTQIRSTIITIPASEWDIALFLPLERFVKASKNIVHMDSVKQIRGM